MPKIRTLIVDDAAVVRRLVSAVVAEDPALEVAGTAANGRIGLDRITHLRPDIVTLDMEMPEMDGLTALAEIRRAQPTLPVIMLSRFTQRGALATLDALALGASDYVALPDQARGIPEAMQQLRDTLLPKIKHLAAGAVTSGRGVIGEPEPHFRRPERDPWSVGGRRIELVVIGASTGGPNALATVLHALPADFQVPIAVVQHMPPQFTRLLAERLTARGPLEVHEATAGEPVLPGHVLIAPGDHHLAIEVDGEGLPRARLHQGPLENSCRPAVDVLLRSGVETFGPRVLAVIMTGMGQDGLRGCRLLREAGGQVLVQDEATSVVWGMPGFVARAGLADQVLPLERLAAEITRRTRKRRPGSTMIEPVTSATH